MAYATIEFLNKFQILDEGHERGCAGCGWVIQSTEVRLLRSARLNEEAPWELQQAWHRVCSIPQWLAVERVGPNGYVLYP